STRDFRRALRPLWGESGLSRSTISRANGALKDAFHAWSERDRSLDIQSAQSLAEAAVNGLVQRGDLAVRGAYIRLANPVPG
ncbi:MAG: hypothetical protein HY680_04455, partial [Chloroflexi bacterium]|nr:hypothetical protein [Chloroflexota bacterium]